MAKVFVIAVVLLQVNVLCRGSLFDPHVFPKTGPFFEGWYMRITDFDNKDSLGFLFGSVLPAPNSDGKAPPIIVSILRRKCSKESGLCKLYTTDAAFKPEQLNITVQGSKPVTKNPDRKSPPYFRWEVDNGHNGGYFEQLGNVTTWNVRVGDLSLKGQADSPVLWDSSGLGPEGWLGYFPLPLHWFVFSLRSRLLHYDIQNVTSGETYRGKNGVVHMEKNWGKSFPRSWIWSEGVQQASNASFAVSGGLVDFSFATIPGYLIGYRNPSSRIDLSFRPVTSMVDTQINGCNGTVKLTVKSYSYRVDIDLYGNPATFSSCLLGPEAQGFRPACLESYDATAVFSVYTRKSFVFSDYVFMESNTFTNIALEFGGLNVCNNTCATT